MGQAVNCARRLAGSTSARLAHLPRVGCPAFAISCCDDAQVAHTIELPLALIGFSSVTPVAVFDVWAGKPLGRHVSRLGVANIPAHGTALLRISYA